MLVSPPSGFRYSAAMSRNTPLVSVIVSNFNYGDYLEQCLQSVVEQTHQNVEVLFSDNASDDGSWEIALSFCDRYPQIFSITRHRRNQGRCANFRHWHSQLTGDYHLGLSSDDVLQPRCIETSINALETHRDAAFAIFSRSILTEEMKEIEELPFLSTDCVMDPPGLALLYLISSFNVTNSQVLYRTPKSPHNLIVPLDEEGQYRSFFRTRVQDFLIALESPVIFLREALVKHRVHSRNHARSAELNMLDVLGQYSLNFEFLEHVESKHPAWTTLFAEQLKKATLKHANTSLRYAARFVLLENIELATKYLHLACALDPDCGSSKHFNLVHDAVSSWGTSLFTDKCAYVKTEGNLTQRAQSYDPPDPWRPLYS